MVKLQKLENSKEDYQALSRQYKALELAYKTLKGNTWSSQLIRHFIFIMNNNT